MSSVPDFFRMHRAPKGVLDWAIANCATMDDAWETARPDWLVWIATRPGVLDDRALRLFAVHCARRVQHIMTGDGSTRIVAAAYGMAHSEKDHEANSLFVARATFAIEVAERHANGQATDEELVRAHRLNRCTWIDRRPGWSPSNYTAWNVARKSPVAAARTTATTASRLAGAAARSAALQKSGHADKAARRAEFEAYAAWLRANVKPRWEASP